MQRNNPLSVANDQVMSIIFFRFGTDAYAPSLIPRPHQMHSHRFDRFLIPRHVSARLGACAFWHWPPKDQDKTHTEHA